MRCLVLIRPGSKVDSLIGSAKPTFAIYKFDRVFCSYELRFGDGAWLKLRTQQKRA